MAMVKEKLENLINEVIVDIGIGKGDFVVERPSDMENGDYSTNVAMVLAKKIGKNPKELAEKFKNELDKKNSGIIEKIEIAGAGFINFYIKDEVFIKNIENILKQKDKYGSNQILKNKKVIIEYTDPNIFKEFHIGHLMSNTIGESLSRILEFSEANVIRANYQGDIGLHIAKAIWGIKNLDIKKEDFSIAILGKAYSVGSQAYEGDNDIKEEINEINKEIYSKSDDEVNDIYKKGRQVSLEHFERIYKKLGTKFDEYFFESEVWENGKSIVLENIDTIFEKSEGAIIFSGEKFDLHTRVFINSLGLPTYEAKELGLVEKKFDKYDPYISVSVTGNDIKEYFKVVFKTMELINPLWASKTKHISHGMLKLSVGKMSSRKGDVITAESIIDEVEKLVSQKAKQIVKKDIEKISIGAIKYSILKQAARKDIIFDLDKSISFDGDSGPYLQYTFVRAKSILEQSDKKPVIENFSQKITNLERLLQRFPEVVERSYKEYEPHYIATYLIELAREFNSYYAQDKIIGSEREEYSLAVVKSASIVFKNGLWLLGIKVPEKM